MTRSVFFLVPVGRGSRLEQTTPQECEDVMNFLYHVGLEIAAKTTERYHFKRVVLEHIVLNRLGLDPEQTLGLGPTYRELRLRLGWASSGEQARRTPMDVNAGRGFIFVSYVGTVHPSGFLAASAGNVRIKSLNEIYRDRRLLNSLRNASRLGGRCGQCEFVSVCGGSRSRAFATTGGALAGDLLCAYQPLSFPFQKGLS